MSRSSFESREGDAVPATVRRASTERNPRSTHTPRIPMRGAGGPQRFDGVLPGSEDRAARHRAFANELHPRLVTARRGRPEMPGLHSHRHGTAREAVAKEER